MTPTDRLALRLQAGANIPSRVMLAHEFNPLTYADQDHYVSTKHDGLRAIYLPRLGFFSREGIPFSEALTQHIVIDPHCSSVLDGEFYCHGMSLQEINGAMAINRSEPTEETKKIKYHLFDLIVSTDPIEKRIRDLEYMKSCLYFPTNVVLVEHRLCKCWLTLHAAFTGAVASDYEGVMLRRGAYTAGRTTNLLKWKANETLTAEVNGFIEGEGKFKGMLGAMNLIAAESRVEFSTGSGWTDEERQHIWDNRRDYSMRSCQIKYLSLSRNGIPKMSTFIKWNK